MPHYAFRFRDSAVPDIYAEAHEYASVEAARTEAVRELSYMVTSRLPDGDRRTFAVTIMDDRGNDLWTARLDYSLEQASGIAQ